MSPYCHCPVQALDIVHAHYYNIIVTNDPIFSLSLHCTFPALTSLGSTGMSKVSGPPADPTELLAADLPWFHSLRKAEPGHGRDEVNEREIRGWEGAGGKETLNGKNGYLIKEWDNSGSFKYNWCHQDYILQHWFFYKSSCLPLLQSSHM